MVNCVYGLCVQSQLFGLRNENKKDFLLDKIFIKAVESTVFESKQICIYS